MFTRLSGRGFDKLGVVIDSNTAVGQNQPDVGTFLGHDKAALGSLLDG